MLAKEIPHGSQNCVRPGLKVFKTWARQNDNMENDASCNLCERNAPKDSEVGPLGLRWKTALWDLAS